MCKENKENKENKEDREFEIACCLDEVDAVMDLIESDKDSKKKFNTYIKKQKGKLKSLNYKGKIRRNKKSK